jgi:ribonuclease HII
MVGVDEVGRGCLAGPLLVIAARSIGDLPTELKDSKLLSRKQREQILNKINICCRFGEGWVSAIEIDKYGLSKALRLGTMRALNNLEVETNETIILDGKVNYLPKRFKRGQTLVDADSLIPIVSAASVYAKVIRDRFMIDLAVKYPNYKFEHHVGYGTKAHMLALKSHGALKYIHRQSFMPIINLNGA